MLKPDMTVVVFIDVQGRLAEAMADREALFAALSKLLRGATELGLPVLWTEQIPEKLGPTTPELAVLLPGGTPIPKQSFSCCGAPEFVRRLAETGRRQVLLCGIEAHVCVQQTARDLLDEGYEVEIAADAVASRSRANKEIALARLRDEGAGITCVEMALMELLRTAGSDRFRAILKIIK